MEERSSILLINKPSGPTSHDIVDIVRKKTGVKCVGHAGTLDPLATGLLIVLVGREMTKRQVEFLGMDKTYEATITLGGRSDTDDVTGKIEYSECKEPSLEQVHISVIGFIGTYEQMPPVYSSKKIGGLPSHKLARRGIRSELTPKKITVYSIDILDYTWPQLTIRTTVSSGTYIRSIARDIGEKLDCGAYIEKLKRTAIGTYSLDQAQSLSPSYL